MSVRRYAAYQDSGDAWIGEIPVGWAVLPLKRDMEFLTSGSRGWAEHYADDGALFIRIGNLTRDGLGLDLSDIQRVAVPTGAEGERTRVQAGDVLFSITAFMGSVAVIPDDIEPAYVSQHVGLARLRGKLLTPKWVGYSTLSSSGKAYLDAQCYGGTKIQLSLDDVANLPMAVPPLDEQHIIISFLDRETAKIDALVAEQERLMALLKEKRQAVISQAVTKGLTPNAKMKPSGVEWLGEVPAHWGIVPLKWLTDPDRPIMYGIVLPGPDVGEGIPILKGGNVKPSRMNLQSMARTTPEIEAPFARARLKAGDLVYAIRGTIGDCETVPTEMEGSNITQDVARVAIGEGVCASWARWALLSSAIRDDLASGSLGAAVRGVNIFDLKRVRLPTPPHREQLDIAEFLDTETSRLERLSEEAIRGIALLKERRAALISAAVTGKIDLRDLTPAEVAA